ncbi:MAG: coproporphyrinogen dehydrogenase HemZ, partial [Firmicutes bacterium]|nr:coproporphyrinogen dehydrogenase HemZ [Bacillota bacterium]
KGVTRICINPQTLNDHTLQSIGRKGSTQEVLYWVTKAQEQGFEVNMDLICGLEGETIAHFEKSLYGVLGASPDNITLHTLCYKRGARNQKIVYNPYVNQMMDFGYRVLLQNGYHPYYLYKQKNALDNLENVGFAKSGKECLNNITTMADCMPTVGVGAGAISKYFLQGGKIERQPNPLDVKVYLQRLDSIVTKKREVINHL